MSQKCNIYLKLEFFPLNWILNFSNKLKEHKWCFSWANSRVERLTKNVHFYWIFLRNQNKNTRVFFTNILTWKIFFVKIVIYIKCIFANCSLGNKRLLKFNHFSNREFYQKSFLIISIIFLVCKWFFFLIHSLRHSGFEWHHF